MSEIQSAELAKLRADVQKLQTDVDRLNKLLDNVGNTLVATAAVARQPPPAPAKGGGGILWGVFALALVAAIVAGFIYFIAPHL